MDKLIKERVVVAYDEETIRNSKAEADRQYRTQNSLKKAAWCAFIAAILYAGIAAWQTYEMRRSTEAAKQAANTAQQQLEASEGAAVNFDVSVSGSFVSDSTGVKLQTTINLRNVGHSPAVEMLRGIEFLPLAPSDIIPERDKVCSEARIAARADALFPGDNLPENWTLTINKDKVDEALKLKSFLHPTLIVCVSYRSIFSDKRHETAKILDVHSSEEKTRGFFLKPEESIAIQQQFLGFLPHPVGAIHVN